MKLVRLLLCAVVALAIVPAVAADAYPSKPIRLFVGYPPGGAVDVVARTVGQQLATVLGQPVVVENKPGANTNIAIRALIDSPPDGYTIMLTANALASNPALYKPAPFDPERDVTPVSGVGRVPVVIAANSGSEFTSLAKLVEVAKAKPGTVNYATPGNGSTPHLAVELFARAAGVKLSHIPYKGGAPAITDVLGGQLPLVAVNALEVLPHVKAGKLRVLAVMSPARSPMLPDTPTIAESGYPGFEASVWYGVIAPPKTPADVVGKLHAAVQKALESGEVQKKISAVGGEVTPGTTAQFAALVHDERVRYDKLVREADIRAD
ncbi:MAG TPA: tripartite tricarboxylate transporter substrate binding protein [Usitatibacter sp.]|nr:tripartite tricarboxylate transporter substrate binding protein [Usitatibacter sp.]